MCYSVSWDMGKIIQMFFLLFSTYFEKIQLDFICNHLSIFNNVYHIKLRSEYMRYQRRQWHPTPVLWPGKSHGRRSLVGCRPCGREELDTAEWLSFHFSLSCIGEGNGNPLQCSCLENPRDGGALSDLAAASYEIYKLNIMVRKSRVEMRAKDILE